MYPNPVKTDVAKIRLQTYSADKVEIKIYDSAGYQVDEINENINAVNTAWEVEWNVSDVNSGLYFMNLTAMNGNRKESVILKIGVIH